MPHSKLIALAQFMGDPKNDLCILAEGNVSARKGADSFLVKASGHSMTDIREEGFVEVRYEPLIAALKQPEMSVADVRNTLNGALVHGGATSTSQPSTEAFMHAYLLSLDGVEFVAHGHPTPLLSLLSLEGAAEFAERRLFPDEIVCCGPAACFVPYIAPGLPLAIKIRSSVQAFIEKWGMSPKSVWLENHGLIALGSTIQETISICSMSVKSARATLGALQTGQPIRWMTREEVIAICDWPDEHFRQRLIREG